MGRCRKPTTISNNKSMIETSRTAIAKEKDKTLRCQFVEHLAKGLYEAQSCVLGITTSGCTCSHIALGAHRNMRKRYKLQDSCLSEWHLTAVDDNQFWVIAVAPAWSSTPKRDLNQPSSTPSTAQTTTPTPTDTTTRGACVPLYRRPETSLERTQHGGTPTPISSAGDSPVIPTHIGFHLKRRCSV